MKFKLLFILVMSSFCVFAQFGEFPFEHISNYDLVGKVKIAIITEIEEITVTGNEKWIHQFSHELHFNSDGYLVKDYLTNNDGFRFLSEENLYDKSNKLLVKTDYAIQTKKLNGKRVKTKKLIKYQEKYEYDSDGRLLSKYQKSDREKEFYLAEKNIYKDGLLIEKLSLNNHLPQKASGYSSGYGNSYRYTYKYDNNNLLVASKSLRYDYIRYIYSQMDSSFQSHLVYKESELDDKKFYIEDEKIYHYNEKGQEVYNELIIHSGIYEGQGYSTFTTYFGTYELEKLYESNGFISGHRKDYLMKNKDTLVKSQYWLKDHKKGESPKKMIAFFIEYDENGSYKQMSYINGKLEKTVFYDSNGKYINQIPKFKSTTKCNVLYDDVGNLISRKTYSLFDNKEVSSIKKEIEYYD